MDKPEDLIGGYFDGLEELPAGVARYTGDIPGADLFAMALIDPGNGRTLGTTMTPRSCPWSASWATGPSIRRIL